MLSFPPGHILTPYDLQKLADLAWFGRVPTGAIFECVGEEAPPGYVRCLGQTVDPAKYPDLAKLVGTLPNAPTKIVKL